MSSESDGDSWASSEAKDWKDGRHRRENEHVAPHAGEVPSAHSRRSLTALRGAFERAFRNGWLDEGWPSHVEETDLYRDLMTYHATEGFSQAVEKGDSYELRQYVGSQQEAPDISGIKAIGKIDDLVTGPAPVLVILGDMGDGKTDFATLLGQRWDDHQPEDRLIGTNIRSLEEKTDWIRNFGELQRWAQQDGDPLENRQRPKLFIGDEMSSKGHGRGKEGYETAMKMGPLVFKIRKYGGALIYIAHGVKSIHPILWRVGKIVQKTSKKKARVADAIRSNRLADIQFEIEGIPPSDWSFDTMEESDWSWSRYAEEDAEDDELSKETADAVAIWTVRECKERLDLSHRETAKYVPYGKDWVADRWREIQAGEHSATIDGVEAVTG